MKNLRPEINRPRILLADDHGIFIESLRALLEKSYTVIGIVPDGHALIAEAAKLKPDLIIVDVGMPLLNGVDAACRVAALLPKVRIVFLTMHDDPNLAAAALELGSIGFVLKHSAASELSTAIEYVLAGKSFVTPRLRSEDWAIRANRAQQFSKELSPRQRDVVQLFAEGRSPKEICGLLNLTYKTVMFHKYHIMEAFHLKSNADLVIFALQHGLIQLTPRYGTAVSRRNGTDP